jgi:hypothetical protein
LFSTHRDATAEHYLSDKLKDATIEHYISDNNTGMNEKKIEDKISSGYILPT